MITLHHCPGTRSMRSLWLLHELGVDFDLRTYPFDKTLRGEAYRKLNPAGRVPTLEINGEVIRESGAITQALCERFDPEGFGRAVGHAERNAWLDWVHFSETISQHTASLTQQHIMLREDHMRSPIIMKLEAARLGKTLDVVEAGMAGEYLLAGGFSAADISVGQAIYMAQHFVRLAGYPRVEAWYARLTCREGFKASVPDGGGLYGQAYYPPWDIEA